jgi:hypothetical protein
MAIRAFRPLKAGAEAANVPYIVCAPNLIRPNKGYEPPL